MSKKIWISVFIIIVPIAAWLFYHRAEEISPNPVFEIGQTIDSLDGVKVFYNGMVSHSGGRNKSEDGYNIGLKYQCVEFVKRYYYEHFHHKMPDAYGNAKDFFDASVTDGNLNSKRNLLQFTNPSQSKPKHGDLIIFDGQASNPYGHVAIIAEVWNNGIEIIQQNPGPFAPSRVKFQLDSTAAGFSIRQERTRGWLRMK